MTPALPPMRELYGTPNLARKPGAQVIVTLSDAEADAASLLLPDAVAVAAPAPLDTDWSPLAGRNVILWANADDVTYIRDCYQELGAVAAHTVRWLNVYQQPRHLLADPDTWTPEAVTQWARTNIETEPPEPVEPKRPRLVHRKAEAPPPAPEPATPRSEKPTLPPFQSLFNAPTVAIDWLATDFLLANEYTLLVGDGGAYKTTVLLGVAAAVAGGHPVLNGFATPQPRAVGFVSGEDSMGVLQNRLRALVAGHRWDAETISANLHALPLEGVLLDDLGWQLHIEAECARLGITLLCFDPLADLISDDENNNSLARPIIQWFRRLTAKGIAIILAHHYSKQSEFRQGQARVRGAGAWANGARAIYTLEAKDGGQWLGCVKMSRAPRMGGRELSIQIENDPANTAIWTSAVVGLTGLPGDWTIHDQRRLLPSEMLILTVLDRHFDEALSWSKLVQISGLSQTAVSASIPRLAELGYLAKSNIGTHHGKPRWAYQVTVDGRNYTATPQHNPQQRSTLGVVASHSATTQHKGDLVKSPHVASAVRLPFAEALAADLGLPPLVLEQDEPGEAGPGIESIPEPDRVEPPDLPDIEAEDADHPDDAERTEIEQGTP